MSRLIKHVALTLAVWGFITSGGHANTFTVEGRDNGHVMQKSDCRWGNTSVWVIVEGKGDCVRYFPGGVNAENELVHVWFHGDRMRQSEAKYNRLTPKRLARIAQRQYERYDIPYISFSRPGVHGSSGNHGERRRPRESKIINAALDQIKSRYRVKRFVLSGQSGGGHVVASLLTMRTDIGCAVITSGVTSVYERLVERDRSVDYTGFNDYFDPIDHVKKIAADPARRIFIVGDPEDSEVPFVTQKSYFNTLKRHGHKAWLIRGKGRGRSNHGLSRLGRKVVKWCVDGQDAASIVKRAEEAKRGKRRRRR